MDVILGDEINELLKKKDFQSIQDIHAGDESIFQIEELPALVTPKGVYIESVKFFKVSHDGNRIWGLYLLKNLKCVLMMQCMRTRKSLIFNYVHQKPVLSVIVSEDLGLAMTGGADNKAVLNCLETGRTIKVIKFGIPSIHCLLRLGSVVAVGGKRTVLFFDLIEQEIMEIESIKTECIIDNMKLVIKKTSKHQNDIKWVLLVGGCNSNKLKGINLPKSITNKSNKRHKF
jgi:WD40 repeat protein